MPEIGTSSSMSGDGKRSDGLRPQATAPILDSTIASFRCAAEFGRYRRVADIEQDAPVPCNCNHGFLAADIFGRCGRAVPAQGRALRRTLPTNAEGRDGPNCHLFPKIHTCNMQLVPECRLPDRRSSSSSPRLSLL